MRALVTGASGFLGSHICDELEMRGAEVLGFDEAPSPWPREGEVRLGDVRDSTALKRAMSGCSVVFNLQVSRILTMPRRIHGGR